MKSLWISGVSNITMIGLLYRGFLFKTGLLVVCGAVEWSSGVGIIPSSDFDSQVRYLLDRDMLTPMEMVNFSTVFYDFQETLQTIWPGSKVFPLGSFVTGLASKSSDADCMVKVPTQFLTSDTNLVLEAGKLLKQHPHLYDRVITKVGVNRRIPLLKFIYVSTKRNCDVNFISDMGLQNSLMMGYYLNLRNKFLSLAAILKLWTKVHGLRSSDTLASNTLNLLIIFYLQQKNLVPAFHLLQKQLVICPVNNWLTRFETIPYNSTTTASLYQLLGGFFKYYSTFNFAEYVVSPLLGYPIRKIAFKDIESQWR